MTLKNVHIEKGLGRNHSCAINFSDCEEETEILVSRPRRRRNVEANENELEKLHNIIDKLEERISELEQKHLQN